VVTHSIDDAAALASHVVALKDGRVVASGDFAGAARRPEFQDLLDPRDSGALLPAKFLRSAHQDAVAGLWLRADHVLLAVQKPQAISARNIIEGHVQALSSDGQGSLLVELETASGVILARVTPEAAGELGLAPGMTAWAVVKAHAV
jgi:molybdate transport system ATP-binding protein